MVIVSRDARERTSAAIRGERRRYRGRLRAHRNGAGHHLLCHPHHQFRPGADDDGDGDGHGGSSRRRLSDMGGGAPRPRLRLCPRGSFLSYRRSAYPGAEPLQFWLARQHSGLCGDRPECSRLYLGADIAGLSANVPGHELSSLGRSGDRSAAADDRDRRGPDGGLRAGAAGHAVRQDRHGHSRRSGNGDRRRRQHHRGRDRRLRRLGACTQAWRAS